MKEAYRLTRKDGAPGIDGVTADDYATNLDAESARPPLISRCDGKTVFVDAPDASVFELIAYTKGNPGKISFGTNADQLETLQEL